MQYCCNDLINCHKAPLQLYNEIVHLFNDYVSSDNFCKYAKLKTGQLFIKQMEVSHPGITTLRPVNKQITLHDNTLVTVPVFDACAMIMDLLTNSELIKGMQLRPTNDSTSSFLQELAVVWQLHADETEY